MNTAHQVAIIMLRCIHERGCALDMSDINEPTLFGLALSGCSLCCNVLDPVNGFACYVYRSPSQVNIRPSNIRMLCKRCSENIRTYDSIPQGMVEDLRAALTLLELKHDSRS